jgi:lipopolysaccharide/colanic/teichoic acid biosynthesis glycosyltransferase
MIDFPPNPIPGYKQVLKRGFDLMVSLLGLLLAGWLIPLLVLLARHDTGLPGLFVQDRIGRFGRPFRLLKIRTMRSSRTVTTTVTTRGDTRITTLGRHLRRWKLDELPQLINVLRGDMSLVGPRPDVAGFADRLTGADRVILTVRPGITGPATLRFRDEEQLLAAQPDPEEYNRMVVFPEKVRLNRLYVEGYGFWKDLGYVLETVFPLLVSGRRATTGTLT